MVSTANTPRHCQAQTREGRPCRGYAVQGSSYCFAHDPALAAERRAARSKGGRARHGRRVLSGGGDVLIREAGDVLALLERAVNDLLTLENSVARARTVGYLAGQALKALELTVLEERVAALERQMMEGGA